MGGSFFICFGAVWIKQYKSGVDKYPMGVYNQAKGRNGR